MCVCGICEGAWWECIGGGIGAAGVAMAAPLFS